MNGHLIPDTPIAVDFWKIRQCGSATIFFLSHIHSDHTVGLTSSWSRPIYCSKVTGELLCEKVGLSEDLIRPLELHNPTLVPLDASHTKMVTVTAIDANHCPGSVMLLFQGYFGTILYTGDFRYTPQMFVDSPLDEVSVDVLYLDNTYCDPLCVFGSREESKETICEIIESYPEYDVLLGMHSLGKPDLLIAIATKFNEYIAVPPLMYKYLEILQVPNVFQVDTPEHECRLRVTPHYSISEKLFSRLTRPTIAIVSTAIYVGLEGTPYANQSSVHVVPYSDHSSYVELREFVRRIRPGRVVPIVGREAKGPFNISFAKRADMSVFDRFLSQRSREPFTIPESVAQRKSSPLDRASMSVAAAKRSKGSFARTVSRTATAKGVVFESSPQKKNVINVQKDSAQCPEDSSTVKKTDSSTLTNASRPNPKGDTRVINSDSNPKVDTGVITSNSSRKVDPGASTSNSSREVDPGASTSNSNRKVDPGASMSNSNCKVDPGASTSNSNCKVDTGASTSNFNRTVDPGASTSNSNRKVDPGASTSNSNRKVDPGASMSNSNHKVDPGASTSYSNRKVDPGASTSNANRKVDPGASTSNANRKVDPGASTSNSNRKVDPGASTSNSNRKVDTGASTSNANRKVDTGASTSNANRKVDPGASTSNSNRKVDTGASTSNSNRKVDCGASTSNSNRKVDPGASTSNSNRKVDTGASTSNSNRKVDPGASTSNSNRKVDPGASTSNSNRKVDPGPSTSNSNRKVDPGASTSNSNRKVDTQMRASNSNFCLSTQVNRLNSNSALSTSLNRRRLNTDLANKQISNRDVQVNIPNSNPNPNIDPDPDMDSQVNIPNLILDTQSISSTAEINTIKNKITDRNTNISPPPQGSESRPDKPHTVEGISDHRPFVTEVQELVIDNNSEKSASSTTSSVNSVVYDIQPNLEVVKLTDDAELDPQLVKLTDDAEVDPQLVKLTDDAEVDPQLVKLTDDAEVDPQLVKLTDDAEVDPQLMKLTDDAEVDPQLVKLTDDAEVDPQLMKLTDDAEVDPQLMKLTDDAEVDPQPPRKKRKLPLMFYSSRCKQRSSDVRNVDIRQTETSTKPNVRLGSGDRQQRENVETDAMERENVETDAMERENVETDAMEVENDSGTARVGVIAHDLSTRCRSESSFASSARQSEKSLVFTCSISKYFERFAVPSRTYASCQAIFSDFVKKQRVRYKSETSHSSTGS